MQDIGHMLTFFAYVPTIFYNVLAVQTSFCLFLNEKNIWQLYLYHGRNKFEMFLCDLKKSHAKDNFTIQKSKTFKISDPSKNGQNSRLKMFNIYFVQFVFVQLVSNSYRSLYDHLKCLTESAQLKCLADTTVRSGLRKFGKFSCKNRLNKSPPPGNFR